MVAAMPPTERGNAAQAATSAAAADKLVAHSHRPAVAGSNKSKKKAPRKVFKAEREKHKRDLLNDLFTDLGELLEADRQNYNGKACILTDTTRILRDLLSQLEFLRKENSTLQNESDYVTMERNELQDENGVLRNEVLELQNELRMQLLGNPGWGHGTTGLPHSASTVFPSQPPTITSAAFPFQQPSVMEHSYAAAPAFPFQQPSVMEHSYAAAPRELNLFPDAAASHIEGLEPSSEDQEAPSHVVRPQARYPTEPALLPVSLGLPRTEDERCSITSKESSSSAFNKVE